MCIPRLYAAASLKRAVRTQRSALARKYSAALCRGLIEASRRRAATGRIRRCIPRLYAAASLKPPRVVGAHRVRETVYSAALCRGLIEARAHVQVFPDLGLYSAALCRGLIEAIEECTSLGNLAGRIPRLYAAASLKLDAERGSDIGIIVFRGSMPRPH